MVYSRDPFAFERRVYKGGESWRTWPAGVPGSDAKSNGIQHNQNAKPKAHNSEALEPEALHPISEGHIIWYKSAVAPIWAPVFDKCCQINLKHGMPCTATWHLHRDGASSVGSRGHLQPAAAAAREE